jgi:hypothetical protein
MYRVDARQLIATRTTPSVLSIRTVLQSTLISLYHILHLLNSAVFRYFIVTFVSVFKTVSILELA